jgi:hypothetical protein
MAPADSLARLRKSLLDRAERGEAPVTRLCREAGLWPKPRPTERPDRQLPEPLVDAIVAYAVEHPTHGQRTIALVLATPRPPASSPLEPRSSSPSAGTAPRGAVAPSTP